MARQNKEQAAAEQAARELNERVQAERFKAEMPALMCELIALADLVSVRTTVTLTPTGPAVKFFDENAGVDDVITYDTAEWEVGILQTILHRILDENKAKAYRKGIAEDAWSIKLTTAERAAIKENIYLLK